MMLERHIKDKLQLEILVEKHLSGQHDQSTHAGGKKVAGVPDHIDLEGKRFDRDSRLELRQRFVDYENAQYAAMEKMSQELYGKPLNELSYMEQADMRIGSNKLGVTDKAYAAKDPDVLAAKAELEDHFLYKDAASQLAYNDDGTRGPKTIGELEGFDTPMEMMIRKGGIVERENWTISYDETVQEYVRDAEGRNTYQKVESTIPEAEGRAIFEQDYKEYLENGNPVYVISNKGLRSMLKDGRAKNYAEVDRPSRAGNTGADYKNNRAVYENAAFGYTDQDDPANRPISTFFSASTDMHPDLLNGYGGTQVILKRSVFDRTTMTKSDSLNLFGTPRPMAEFLSTSEQRNGSLVSRAAHHRKVNGSNYFLGQQSGFYQPELQIHGGVSVNDISKIVFQDKAPANMIGTLSKLGIEYEVIPKVDNKW